MTQGNLEKLSTLLRRMELNKTQNDQIQEFATSALRGVNLVTKVRTRLSFDQTSSLGGSIQLMFHARTRAGNHRTITLSLHSFERFIKTDKTLSVYEGESDKVFERRKLCFK